MNGPFSIIYDNDMGNDIDDAFAQVMAARAHALGKTKLIPSLSSNTNPWSVAANDALNRYCGVNDCPFRSSHFGFPGRFRTGWHPSLPWEFAVFLAWEGPVPPGPEPECVKMGIAAAPWPFTVAMASRCPGVNWPNAKCSLFRSWLAIST